MLVPKEKHDCHRVVQFYTRGVSANTREEKNPRQLIEK